MGIDASFAVPLLAGAVIALAGVVKGVVGLGLPTVSMALLALVVPPAQAAAWLVVPSLVTNLWQSRPWAGSWSMLRRLAGLQLGIALGTLGSAWVLGAPAGTAASAVLGAALLAYAAWGLSNVQASLPRGVQRWAGPLAGAVTGLITAVTGVFVIPAVPYLQALQLPRDDLIQAMGLSFTVATLALAGGLAVSDAFGEGDAMWSVLMLVPALLGMQIGQRLRSRLSARAFRTCLLLGLGGLGLHMVVRACLP